MTINVIQGAKGRTAAATSIASSAITTSAGSALVACAVCDTGTFSGAPPISDSKGNTWTQIGSEIFNFGAIGGSQRARLYYSELATVGSGHTVTASFSTTVPATLLVVEIPGGLIPGIFDKTAQGNDATSPYASAATATTAQAIELLLGAFFGISGSNPATHAVDSSSAPTSGWSITAAAEETNGASFYTGAIASQRVTSTGAYSVAWTEVGGGAGAAIYIATFKEAAISAAVAVMPTPRLIQTDRVLVTGDGLPQAFAPRKVQVYPSPASFDFPVQNVPPLGQATPEVMRLKPFRAAPFLARVVPAAASGTSTPTSVAAALATHSYLAQVPQVRSQVRPGQVTHTYTAQTPQVRASVKPLQVTHTYVGQVPQVRSQVRPGQVTHTYTAQVPQVRASVKPAQATHTYTAQVPQVRAQVRPAQATHTYTGRTPNIVSGASIIPPVATHSYTGRVAQVRAQVRPAQVTHSYTGRVPQVQIATRVSAVLVAHTYTSRVPGFKTSIPVPRATHTYTSRAPAVVMAGAPLYGFGARNRVGGAAARDPWQRIGSESAKARGGAIGGESAQGTRGKIGSDEA